MVRRIDRPLDRKRFHQTQVYEAALSWARKNDWRIARTDLYVPTGDTFRNPPEYLWAYGISACNPRDLMEAMRGGSRSVDEDSFPSRVLIALPDLPAVAVAIERFKRWHPQHVVDVVLVGESGETRHIRVSPSSNR